MIDSKDNKVAFNRDKIREQKRMAILVAGARLFTKNGFDRTSLDDIANELKVTKRTLYYYIKSKDDILFDCNRMALDFMQPAIKESQDHTKTVLIRIEDLLRQYATLLANDFGACLVLCKDDVLSEESRKTLHTGRKNLDTVLRKLLQEGIHDGTINKCNTKFTAAAIFGALNWVPYWHIEKDGESREEVCNQILKTFFEGIRVR